MTGWVERIIFPFKRSIAKTIYFDRSSKEIPDVICTKGIVILDEESKERILIGATIPRSKNRIREIYGPNFPPEIGFMDIYKSKVKSATTGMLIIDEEGFDKLAIGDPVPDPYYGAKIGAQTGIVIADSLGAERGGYGILNIDGRYRVVLGLDRNDGIEGISFGVDDKEGSKITIRSQDLNELIRIGEGLGKNGGLGIEYQKEKVKRYPTLER